MSMFVRDGTNKHESRLIKAFEDLANLPESYAKKPEGVFGVVATIICGNVKISSKELDFEFTVPFDDNLEPNEAEITIYNLTKDTIKQFSHHAQISIEAGYEGDTGVIFSGFVDRVVTSRESSEKKTVIKCLDDVTNKTVESLSFGKGTKASHILKTLIDKAGLSVAVMNIKRDYTFKEGTSVDGDLMNAIRQYSEICGVSTYVCKGKIYCRHISEGDNINFKVCTDTGMIGSPEEYQEEISVEDFEDIINGYEIEMLLQHRMQTAAIIDLSSIDVTGKYRVRSGEHTFNNSEAITKVKVM